MERPARVLLVRLSALGDVLHALPVLSSLRAALPDAHISWVVEDRAVDLLRQRHDLDRLVIFPRRTLSGALRGRPAPSRLGRGAGGFVRELRAGGHDLAIDLQGNLKSGWVTRLSGAPVRFGWRGALSREGNHLFTNRHVSPPAHRRHKVELALALASQAVGIPLPYVAPDLPRTDEDRETASALLAARGLPAMPRRCVVAHPGTSGFGAFKRWPPDRFGALARRLVQRDLAVVVTHGPGEATLAGAVVDASDGCAVALETPSMRVLAEVAARASLFVAPDTGPLHLAALVGTPVLGLYGPKDPAVYGPYGIRGDGTPGVLSTLTQDDVACRPCTLRRCADPLCMTTMSVERVAEVAAGLIERNTLPPKAGPG